MAPGRRPTHLARFYSRIGDHGWRSTRYFTYSVRAPLLRHWLAAQLPARPTRILSIGCGTGEVEGHLAGLGHPITGLDFSGAMLKRARGRGLARVVQADSHALPFAAERFAVALFLESIGHLDLETAFREARRVLRRSGRLLLTTYSGKVETHGSYRKYGCAEILAALAAAGFRVRERRFLSAKRSGIVEAPSESSSSLLYVLAAKAAPAKRVLNPRPRPGARRRR